MQSNMCCVAVGLDPDDYEAEEKSDKSKSPNSIQSGKWQLGFQGKATETKEKTHFVHITRQNKPSFPPLPLPALLSHVL